MALNKPRDIARPGKREKEDVRLCFKGKSPIASSKAQWERDKLKSNVPELQEDWEQFPVDGAEFREGKFCPCLPFTTSRDCRGCSDRNGAAPTALRALETRESHRTDPGTGARAEADKASLTEHGGRVTAGSDGNKVREQRQLLKNEERSSCLMIQCKNTVGRINSSRSGRKLPKHRVC